jgi:enoyl-CoA hydratase
MGTLVAYEQQDAVATITMDDGKVNVLSPSMLSELGAALDQAETDHAVVVLTGRAEVFSAGFELSTLRGGGKAAVDMLMAGFELAERLLSYPTPVVMACNGNAVAMGLFVLLSGDLRIGAAGPYRLVANEVAIGLTMPWTAVEIGRQRLTPAHFTRAMLLAEPFDPDGAVAAGMLDRVVPHAELADAAAAAATQLAKLDLAAHAGSKKRVRASALAAIRAGIEADDAELRKFL